MGHTLFLVRHCATTSWEPEAALTTQGEEQALSLAEVLAAEPIGRIVSSPFVRAFDSVVPLARRLGLPIETDARLVERVLCAGRRDDWRERLEESFDHLDRRLEGGETSGEAMARGAAVIDEILAGAPGMTVVVSHGNLLTLMLKHLDPAVGFSTWAALRYPDVYRVERSAGSVGARVERLPAPRGAS